jgi:hypothetical protein
VHGNRRPGQEARDPTLLLVAIVEAEGVEPREPRSLPRDRLAAASSSRLTALKRSPAGSASLRRVRTTSQSSTSLVSKSKSSPRPSMPTASAGPKDISGDGRKPWLYDTGTPARLKARCNVRMRSKCDSQRRSPSFTKRTR